MHIGLEHEEARHLRILDRLNGVEDADVAEVSGKRAVRADLLRRAITGRCEIGSACAADRLKTGCDRNSGIE